MPGNFSSRAPVRQGRTRKLKEKGGDVSEEHQVTHELRFSQDLVVSAQRRIKLM